MAERWGPCSRNVHPMRTATALLALLLPALARPDAVDRFMADQVARAHVPGAAVAVVRDGRIVKLAVYGVADLEHGAKVRPDSLFQIASVTKLLTGVLLMGYVQDGKVGLDDPVGRWLPSAPEAWSGVTLRHLATHTSGLAAGPPDPALRTVDDAVAAAMKVPLAARPGERAEYGSPDFTVLAAVLEKAGGKPFPDLLRERVLATAGARDARFEHARDDGLVRSADVLPGRVTTYRWTGEEQRVAWFLYPEHTYAAGGLFASIRDMAALVAALQRGALLRPETFEAMASPPVLADGRPSPFGIGCTVGRHRGWRAVGHSGGPALGDVLLVPEARLGVVVLTSQKRLIPQLAEGVADLFLADRRTPAPAIPDASPEATARVRGVLLGMAAGKVDPALLAPAARELAPMLGEWGAVSVGLFPPLTGVALVQEERTPAAWTRRYRVTFGKKVTRYRAALAADGTVLEVEREAE